MFKTADHYEKLTHMQVFSRKIVHSQNVFRRRQSSKRAKRALLNDLWDRFIEQNKVTAHNVDKLLRKAKHTKHKAAKASLLKEAEKVGKDCNMTIEQLYNVGPKVKEVCMEKYFQMRLADYMI